MTLQATPLTPVFGAAITGVDATREAPAETAAALRAALDDYSLLVLRDQKLTDDQQVAFSRVFGALEDSLTGTRGEGSYFAKLSNVLPDGGLADPESQRMLFSRANELWHSDSSFKEVPGRVSLLSGRTVPPEGGETEFASLRAAYAALPEETKRRIEGLVCEHDLAHSRDTYDPRAMTAEQRGAYPPVRHAMVRTNPNNGRKSLYIGAHVRRIVGWPDDEGRALIDELMDFATRPEFVYRHAWRTDDLAIWDNRCTLHRGRPWDWSRHARVMQRTTVAGLGPTVGPNAVE